MLVEALLHEPLLEFLTAVFARHGAADVLQDLLHDVLQQQTLGDDGVRTRGLISITGRRSVRTGKLKADGRYGGTGERRH